MDAAGWVSVLRDALSQTDTVFVIDAVREHLGSEPSSSELNAARRAAHRLAHEGGAVMYRVRQQKAGGSTRQVLALSPKGVAHPSSEPPTRRGRPRSELQVARTLVNTVAKAGQAAEHLDLDRVDPAAAAELAERLRHVLNRVDRFERSLRVRAGQSSSDELKG